MHVINKIYHSEITIISALISCLTMPVKSHLLHFLLVTLFVEIHQAVAMKTRIKYDQSKTFLLN